jgi:hypothetical protein
VQHFTLDSNGRIALPSHIIDLVIDVGQVSAACITVLHLRALL